MTPARPPAPRPGNPTRPAVPRRPAAPRAAASRASIPARQRAPRPEDTSGRSARSAPEAAVSPPTQGSPAEPGNSVARPDSPVVVAPRRTPVVSEGSEARFAERVRARRARAWRRAGWWIAAVAVLGGLGWLLLGSPVLALDREQVVVTGAGAVVREGDVAVVVDAVDGVPLPRLDTIGLRAAILDVPGVREARVTRAWPRGLTISLVAREPVAAVPEGDGVQLLDVEGVAVGRADKAPEGLPLVDVPVGDARTLAAVLGVLEGLPADLAKDVRSVAAKTQDTVTMELRDGARVDWGSADETELKAAVLQALRKAKVSKDAQWFDVSAPTLPVTKS